MVALSVISLAAFLVTVNCERSSKVGYSYDLKPQEAVVETATVGSREIVALASEFTKATKADPCAFAESYGTAVQAKKSFWSSSKAKPFFEEVQADLEALGASCKEKEKKEAQLTKVSARVDELKAESAVSATDCTKIVKSDSIKKATTCLAGAEAQVKTAEGNVASKLAIVDKKASDSPEILKKGEQKKPKKKKSSSWFSWGSNKKEEEEEIEEEIEEESADAEVWCKSAVSFSSKAGNWWSGVTLGFSGNYEKKQKANEMQWIVSNFTKACEVWHKSQKELKKKEIQRNTVHKVMEEKQIELNCLSVTKAQHSGIQGCAKITVTLPDAQEEFDHQRTLITTQSNTAVAIATEKLKTLKAELLGEEPAIAEPTDGVTGVTTDEVPTAEVTGSPTSSSESDDEELNDESDDEYGDDEYGDGKA